VTQQSSLSAYRLEVGDALPAYDVPITSTLIVAGAIASRDFYPAHHDKRFAERTGVPDIFMNILTTNGLVGRYVREWAGRNTQIKDISIRLGVPNFPGDVLRMSGSVAGVDTAQRIVVIDVRGENDRGVHVMGSAQVQLPEEFDDGYE
jgi:acyl dehydratase